MKTTEVENDVIERIKESRMMATLSTSSRRGFLGSFLSVLLGYRVPVSPMGQSIQSTCACMNHRAVSKDTVSKARRGEFLTKDSGGQQ
jgi:hypothetical protein